jgi:prepilin-type N-terminal cleavage/methylation domain-containing protein
MGRRLARKGMSIIEVLVAAAVLSFGIAMVFRVFFTSASVLRHLDNRMTADLLIDAGMWKARSMTYGGKSGFFEKTTVGDSPQITLMSKARRAPMEGLLQIEASAGWTEGKKNVFLHRFLYDKG